MGVPHSASSLPLSALGDACVRRDLTAIHEILDTLGYKDDEGVANEVCTVVPSFSDPLINLVLISVFFFITAFFSNVDRPNAAIFGIKEKG